MSRHRRVIDATLRRHLSAVNRTERISGHAGSLVSAALKAALAHLPDKPNHFNLRPALNSIREIVHRLRHVAAYVIAMRLKELANWGHLAMARALTTGGKRELAKLDEAILSEDLMDYLRLIIRPPAQWLLRLMVGAAPDLLTRLIDPQAASDVVLQGVAAGYDRKRIAKDLTQLFGGFENAARRVARTEGARISVQSQLHASEEIPDLVIGYKVYAVPKTEYSRIDHLKRSGTSYFRNPTGGQLGFDVMPQPPFDNPGQILQHNCRCVTGGSRVRGRIKSIARSWYEGQGIELRTRHGARLTVTANHPVATDKGFVPAHALRKGDCVLSDGIRRGQPPDDIDDGIPTIEDEFEAALIRGHRLRRQIDPLEFHGDGASMKGDIRVVFPDAVLVDRSGAEIGKGDDQFRFVGGERGAVGGQSLAGFSLGGHRRPLQQFGGRSTANRGAGLLQHSLQGAALDTVSVGEGFEGLAGLVPFDEIGGGWDHVPHPPHPHRFFFVSGSDPILNQHAAHDGIAGTEFLLKLRNRYPGEIARDELVGVKSLFLASPVYSIDTGLGYYVGSENMVGIIQGNCGLVPLFSIEDANSDDLRDAVNRLG